MSENENGPSEIQMVGAMRQAWEAGVTDYTPHFRDEALEPECGAVEVSLKNLRKIVKSGARVCSLFGSQNGVLVCFCGGISYLATGFQVSRSADELKLKGFAQFASEVGLGSAEKVVWFFGAIPPDYEGELQFPVPGDLSVVK